MIQDISYVYDPVGNITRSYDHSNETVFHNNQKVDPLSDYTYDALYRLIKSNGRQHTGINVNTDRNNEKDGDFKQSKYAPLSDSNALENYQESYGYDEAGNLIKTSHIASNRWNRTNEMMPDSNHLKSVKSGNGVNDSYEVSYDDSGNMKQLNVNSNVDLTWNCCDNLVKVLFISRPGGKDDCDYYTYDSNEMRTRKVSERLGNGGAIVWKDEKRYLGNYEEKYVKNETSNGEQTVLIRQSLRVMDGQSCVAIIHFWEQDDNKREVDQVGDLRRNNIPTRQSLCKRIRQALNGTLSKRKSLGTRSVRFQLGNHLGSVALEVDKDGDIISYEEYFPYGGTALIAGRNQREVKVKEYRYSGKERDDSTGLYYYGARYYAPWLGRWISADPAGTVDGLNVFEFVGGNPISQVDVGGMMKRKAEVTQSEFAGKGKKARNSYYSKPPNEKTVSSYVTADSSVYAFLKVNGKRFLWGANGRAEDSLKFFDIGIENQKGPKDNPHAEDWVTSSFRGAYNEWKEKIKKGFVDFLNHKGLGDISGNTGQPNKHVFSLRINFSPCLGCVETIKGFKEFKDRRRNW